MHVVSCETVIGHVEEGGEIEICKQTRPIGCFAHVHQGVHGSGVERH